MLPLEWLRPTLPHRSNDNNDEETILPSFAVLQRKTWETLYSQPPSTQQEQKNAVEPSNDKIKLVDKSPKGSVDGPIQELVDLINHHTSISTLSSCSGRISLFDPNGIDSSTVQAPLEANSTYSSNHTPSPSPATATASKAARALTESTSGKSDAKSPVSFTETSGKGRGTWVLVTHHLLEDPDEMVRAIFRSSEDVLPVPSKDQEQTVILGEEEGPQQPWMLKFEPMLLHVAARSLRVGQALLQLALECGFRESGLVVTPKRVTVAIRSHSLSLSMPLMGQSRGHHVHNEQHPLCPSPDFVRALVHECNQRLQANWKHLNRLHRALEAQWFKVEIPRVIARVTPVLDIHPLVADSATLSMSGQDPHHLNSLRLWSAAVVSIANKHLESGDEYTEVYTFGGYGKGPIIGAFSKNPPSQRTNAIYRLIASQPSSKWEAIQLSDTTFEAPCWKGLTNLEPVAGGPSSATKLPLACQGVAACHMKNQNWIVLWGGRTSPNKPLDSRFLWLFHPPTRSMVQLPTQPSNAKGWPPPRWGHSLVPLSNDRIALVGGNHLAKNNHSTASGQDCTTMTRPGDSLSEVYILHFLGPSLGFVWECLDEKLPGTRLHATSIRIPAMPCQPTDSNNESSGGIAKTGEFLLVIGGIPPVAQTNPLQMFMSTPIQTREESSSAFWACHIGTTVRFDTGDKKLALSTPCTLVSTHMNGNSIAPGFGAAACSMFGGRLTVVSGGLSSQDIQVPELVLDNGSRKSVASSCTSERDIFQAHVVQIQPRGSHQSLILSRVPITIVPGSSTTQQQTIDFGSMVHHGCVPISDSEFLLVGGGVTSFAFGEAFAQSYRVQLEIGHRSGSGSESLQTDVNDHDLGSAASTSLLKNPSHSPRTMPGEFQQQAETTPSDATSGRIGVVYVAPANAKRTKAELNHRGWLHKGFRMTKVAGKVANPGEADDRAIVRIAIPVLPQAWPSGLDELLAGSDATEDPMEAWHSCILDRGEEEMPFSTAKFAAKPKK